MCRRCGRAGRAASPALWFVGAGLIARHVVLRNDRVGAGLAVAGPATASASPETVVELTWRHRLNGWAHAQLDVQRVLGVGGDERGAWYAALRLDASATWPQ